MPNLEIIANVINYHGTKISELQKQIRILSDKIENEED